MHDLNPPALASISGRPIHALLVPFPAACFVGTLATDLAYWRTEDMMWANFSIWLLTAGLFFGSLAAFAALIDFFGSRVVRTIRLAWYHGFGGALALVLALLNAFVHSRDAYTSVVPTGLILSALTVLVLLIVSWNGFALVFRHRIGVMN